METKMEITDRGGKAEEIGREMREAFEALKASNEARLEEIEKRGSVDPVTEEKISRIDAKLERHGRVLERMEVRGRRPDLSGPSGETLEDDQLASWRSYMRSGGRYRGGMDTKALTGVSDVSGGYVVPPELDRMIESQLRHSSIMRQIASVRRTSSYEFEKPVVTGQVAASWASRDGIRVETTTSDISVLKFPAADLYAAPAATQSFLDDAEVDIEQWLSEEIENAFASLENEAFINGEGSDSPQGILSYDRASNGGVLPSSTIGTVASGAAGGFASSSGDVAGSDSLLDLVYALDSRYRVNGRFVMNRRSLSAVRKLKDSSGAYLWQPGTQANASTLLGYPVTEYEEMPDIAAGSVSIAFGDFERAYLIVDRQGVQVLRDPYSSKPLVLFYTTRRVGGGIQNFDALKLMVTSTS